ncbi:MAG: aminodeoxychorismate lyase [Methylovulum sp.]|jgi:4-amino-4-deoxychorismate lyase|nr:aminodeoxychorismate lyase [Methylovulum sp.]MCF7998202.1 aminodeoxychorismate lyase [Methylovulum sp.]
MFLVNGECRSQIDISDRGLQYGDGLFETIAVHNYQPIFWQDHFNRLQAGCLRLRLPVPDSDILLAEVNQLCSQSNFAHLAVLKLMITRGSGGRGYRQPDPVLPTRILSLHPYPDYPAHFQSEGIVARFCEARLAINPLLAGLKHLNRLEQVLARAEWQNTAIQEGIMLNVHGWVIEGTMTNLFYVKAGILYTAILDESGILGIMRQKIIELSRQNGLHVCEQRYTQIDLFSADEVFFSNSLIGIWPVKQIDRHMFAVGIITKQLILWLQQLHEADRAL